MSRILFAAARRARIEALYQREWIPANHLSLEVGRHTYRIHSDDAHLQYGPISTVLREVAAQNFSVYEDDRKVYTYAAYEMASAYEASWEKKYKDDDQRVLFLLFLAEALADSGL
jgi:hypothetical protein